MNKSQVRFTRPKRKKTTLTCDFMIGIIREKEYIQDIQADIEIFQRKFTHL
jgi:hypothetical protein